MVSQRSLINFGVINTVLLLFALGEYLIVSSFFYSLPVFFLTCVAKNTLMLKNVEYNTKDKPDILPKKRVAPKERYRHEFYAHLVSASFVEACTKFVVYYNAPPTSVSLFTFGSSGFGSSSLLLFFWFVLWSFAFELIFDFFHYWAHRLLHSVPFLYRNLHKKHHRHQYPTPIIAFYQDPIDLLITNSLPTLITLALLPNTFSLFVLVLFFTYKSHIEICGHCGKDLPTTPAFPQFIWLPRSLGIELYTHQHDKHHTLNNCNYSKRFSIWDRVFGTLK